MYIPRRKLLTLFGAIGLSIVAGQYFFGRKKPDRSDPEASAGLHHSEILSEGEPHTDDRSSKHSPGNLHGGHPGTDFSTQQEPHPGLQHTDEGVADNLAGQSNYAKSGHPDLIVSDGEFKSLETAIARLERLQTFVGHANFNVIGWDQSLMYARNYANIGTFKKSEIEFVERIFSLKVDRMGFHGEQINTRISSIIRPADIKKIPGTGHFLFKGKSLNTYEKIHRDIGENIILTSGIRSVVKQMYLFLKKTYEVGGNLSIAAFELAPPGHSFHAVGDFDVGKANFGKRNFTIEFASTPEFKKLSELGYIDIRYPINNPAGVRYEPWHIRVV